MRIYMDVCCLQRPLDDRSQPRVNLEAEAVLAILQMVQSGDLELVSSDIIAFEIGKIPDADRQQRAEGILALAHDSVELTDNIEQRAESLVKAGIKPLDALHLESAAASGVDRFCTCDDRLLKKSKELSGFSMRIVSPLELLTEVPR